MAFIKPIDILVSISYKYIPGFPEANVESHKEQLIYGMFGAVPNLETRSEYTYLRSSGADMVGMNTVPYVIVAN